MEPVRILLSGCMGQMGRVVSRLCAGRPDCLIAAGIDRQSGGVLYPVCTVASEVSVPFDVAVDFSHPLLFEPIVGLCCARKKPLVMATTGLSDGQLERLESAAAVIPVFRSANMSVGVNLMQLLVARAAAALPGFDIEIIERHHRRKVDAPSGTALMLADCINRVLPVPCEYVYDRQPLHQSRSAHEIGIHSVRGGTIAGTHEVLFAGTDETLTITHEASSREVFASGALRAAVWLSAQAPGLYDMQAMLSRIV